MRKGGYQIVNFKNIKITVAEATVVEGVGSSLLNSHNKRTVVSGLNIGGTEYPDFEVLFKNGGGTFTGTVDDNTISVVASTDTVTITQ